MCHISYQEILPVPAVNVYTLYPERLVVSGVVLPADPLQVNPALTLVKLVKVSGYAIITIPDPPIPP
jgi:hypothetical protein